MAKQPDTIDATTQTQINGAPNDQTTAGDPRQVETIDQPLVYNDGSPVGTTSADDGKAYTLYSPYGGTEVQVTGSARRDVLVARGYTTTRTTDSAAASA